MAIRYLTDAPKPISTGEDIARGGATGLVEGGVSLPGAFGDLRTMGESVAKWAQDKMGVKGPAPKMRGSMPVEALAGAAEKFAKAHGIDPRIARTAFALMPGGGMAFAPSSADIIDMVGGGKPLYQPQTTAGQYTRTAAQLLPAALAPGTAVQRVARVAVPAVTSETAGQLTKGTPMEPYARMAGALLGGGATELALRPGPQDRLLAQASRGANEQQIAAARQLMEQGAQRGVRLTMAEALQQVTNGATGMGRLQRVVEGTRGGGERLAPVMADRPAQVRQAVAGFADTVAPATTDPYMAGSRAQEAAGEVLNGVRQQVNANARPFYDALQHETLPAASPDYHALMQDPAYAQGLQAVRSNEVLNAPLAQLPDNNLAVVNEVVKQLDTMAENARPNPASPNGNAQMSAAFEAARSRADQLASSVSEPWRLSRAMVASGREAFLEPLQAGPMGAIAQTGKPLEQTAALFPTKPPEGAAPATAQTLEMLPNDQARGLVRQQIMSGLNERAQDLSTGPNQWGGAGWAAQQFGNPEQAAVMRAGVGAATGDAAAIDPLVEVMRATGRRQAPGSLTAYNSRDLEELGNAGALGEAARTGLNPPGAFRRVGQALQNWQTETNAGRLADAILADPAEAERILLHAREVVPPGAALQAIERTALAAQLTRQPQLEGTAGGSR